MLVQSRPASRPVIGVAPERAALGSGVTGDVDRVTGCGPAVLDPAGLGDAAPGAGALPQAASAASDPATSTTRATSDILTS